MGLLAKATAIREQLEREGKLNPIPTIQVQTAPLKKPEFETKTEQIAPIMGDKFLSQNRSSKPSKLKPNFKHTIKSVIKKNHRSKLRKLSIALFLGLSLQTAKPTINYQNIYFNQTTSNPNSIEQTFMPSTETIETLTEEFARNLQHSQISNNDRDNLARMLYGEAGRGADAFEVLHTVLNRVSSPLFKGTLNDILTAKNQYVGYRPENPVDPRLREIVDFVVDEWEANGCQKIDGCNHYYFVTGIPNVCNKFEISEDPQGRWVPNDQKKYTTMQHYCHTATDQAARFNHAHEHLTK